MFPSLTCGSPVLLGQGVREVFDPQVMIVTWWVRWGQQRHGPSQTTGVVTRPEGGEGANLNLEHLYRPPPSTQQGGGSEGAPTESSGGGKVP